MWSSQNTAFDHIFDHLQTRTTWKQCQQEHTKAPFSDTKAPKITRNYTKNLCRTLRDAEVVGSIPVASTKKSTSFDKKLVDFYSSRKAWYVITACRVCPCHRRMSFRLDAMQFYRIDCIPLCGLHTRCGVIKTRVQLTP